MAPTILNMSLFCIGIFSIFLYILFILTLRKFRKNEPFNSPFFVIFVSVGIGDILMLIVKYGNFSLPRWGWLPKSLTYGSPHFVYFRIGYFIYFYLQYSQYLGSLFLAWNRYSAIAYPTIYKVKWNGRFLKRLLLVQWLVPIIVPLSSLFFNVTANITSEEEGMVDPQFEYPAILFYILGNAVFGLIYVFLIFRFYTVAIYKIWQHKRQIRATPSNDRSRKYEVKLAINGFVIFILMFLCVSFFWIVLFSSGKGQTLHIIFEVLGDMYCWNNLYVMLVLNGRTRRHLLAFMKCTHVVPDSVVPSVRKNQNRKSVPTPR